MAKRMATVNSHNPTKEITSDAFDGHVSTVTIVSRQLTNLRFVDDIIWTCRQRNRVSTTSEQIRKSIEDLRTGN